MKHLTSWSVFEKFEDIPGEGDAVQKLAAMGIEGLELFTLFEPVDVSYYKVPAVTSVHLPYALDWHSAWEGRNYGGDVGDIRYFYLGHTREEMVDNLKLSIDYASVLNPAYGVLHASNTDMRQVLERKHRDDGMKVLSDFIEMVNRAVSQYPDGEPPFKIAFENLWWEGLLLRSPAEWRLMEDKLEFDNWGFTLDTGHLMNSCEGAYDEDSAIDEVLKVVDGYPQDMKDRIGTMHLQLSTTAEYRHTFIPESYDPEGDFDAYMQKAYKHAGNIDQHRPYSSKRVNEIVDAVKPDYLTHELFGSLSGKRYEDIIQQRKLFD
ncbi:MAG: TIM barrel protein [archaeon]|nr:TIM barrel protein [archaeon]